MRTIMYLLVFMALGIMSIAGIAIAQSVTQLDSDHYFVQFNDGSNETISNQQTSTNVNSCLTLINRYGVVLNEINQGNEVTSDQLQTAIQSVTASTALTAQPALGTQVNGM